MRDESGRKRRESSGRTLDVSGGRMVSRGGRVGRIVSRGGNAKIALSRMRRYASAESARRIGVVWPGTVTVVPGGGVTTWPGELVVTG